MELISLVTTDLTAITRGRSLPLAALESAAVSGCGWVPANSALTPQDIIAETNPWGAHGDLRLLPDLATRVDVASAIDGEPALHYVHGDLHTADGEVWSACPRSLLRRELERYRQTLGWQVCSAFEHEFTLEEASWRARPAFSLQAQRQAGVFARHLMDALDQAGCEPENFLPEYGRFQYEVTCRPADGLASADRAVDVREIVRDVARQLGLQVSFTPQPGIDSVSNGVHLHLSFVDTAGQPVLYDDASETGLSALGRHWAAGVLHYLPALCALTAPSPVSYLRLKPHHWSSAYACLGVRNREAALRVCPPCRLGIGEPQRQFSLEYRVLDATANPHLAMAAILAAGRLGVENAMPLQARADQDPDSLTSGEREALGIRRLPEDLSGALDQLAACQALTSTLPEALLSTYRALKTQELANVAALDAAALCDHYRAIY